jgi:hypothetical protein
MIRLERSGLVWRGTSGVAGALGAGVGAGRYLTAVRTMIITDIVEVLVSHNRT